MFLNGDEDVASLVVESFAGVIVANIFDTELSSVKYGVHFTVFIAYAPRMILNLVSTRNLKAEKWRHAYLLVVKLCLGGNLTKDLKER